jgi:hypothetical protein
MLREIKKPNRDHARRVLQCLVVAIRPLRVEELAEVLAVDFEDAEGVPKLKPSWRWEDQEQALLTSCSSLIAVVGTGDSRVVQFSHFSVKEYLTSARLATSSQDVSRYQIALEPAHTILAQACVSVLVQLHDHDEEDEVGKNAPLARYAAEHWARHAQFEDVVSRIKGMDYLFDPDKPYFTAWCQLYDIDTPPSERSAFHYFARNRESSANTPLYYAALCGFRNLVEQLIVKHPQHVYALGGHYKTPAVAALGRRHFELAQLLHRSGSSMYPWGDSGWTLLGSVANYGDPEMVQLLLDYGVDVNGVNTQAGYYCSPLHNASWGNDPRSVRLLLDRGADPNLREGNGPTPLHNASNYGKIEIARLLIEHGASVKAKDDQGRTPLDVASGEERDEIIKLLLEHSAK